MNSAAKGNAAELRTARLLQADGWTVGSRRHMAGPGDLIATKPGEQPRIIEVKARKSLYNGFTRPDRQALYEYAVEHGLRAEVAWFKPRSSKPQFLSWTEWPSHN